MTPESIYKNLVKNFHHEPTSDQEKLFSAIGKFLVTADSNKVFIVKGYAGTGKTSFINALIKTLPSCGFEYTLLAPTGRSAKVISEHTSAEASTIHKAIYEISPGKSASLKVSLGKNKKEKTIFIVDEASMISSGDDKQFMKGRNLLDDLLAYVESSKNCSLIFIGDTAQLPPVGELKSCALDEDFIARKYLKEVETIELKDVVRQARDSGILMNATALRILIGKSAVEPVLKTNGFPDVEMLANDQVTDNIHNLYSNREDLRSLIVCRSNKQANKYNAYIRKDLFGFEEPLDEGDRLMVVKNNYFWLEESSSTKFIANGDIIRIKKILEREEKFGFSFADAVITLADYPQEGELTVKLLLNTINSEAPALDFNDQKKLFDEIYNSFGKKMKGAARVRKTYEDPYYNSLQVKFSYAVTCHKAQGGQWENVFVDPGFMYEQMYNTEYLRWLYTAVTRAKAKLLLVNFEQRHFRD